MIIIIERERQKREGKSKSKGTFTISLSKVWQQRWYPGLNEGESATLLYNASPIFSRSPWSVADHSTSILNDLLHSIVHCRSASRRTMVRFLFGEVCMPELSTTILSFNVPSTTCRLSSVVDVDGLPNLSSSY
ncbi:hypothetical protein TNCV_2926651 [Trichonephila clavipes]|nr:hypothetical protein TNCV_2926651 [Trichonephila clavipes]